jgi:hypothetical protein
VERAPRRRGLGKGLDEVLAAAAAPRGHAGAVVPLPPRPDAGDHVLDDTINAGLDALVAAFGLDLAAYLHCPDAGGPELRVRASGPPEAVVLDGFELLDAMRDLGPRDGDVGRVTVGRLRGLAVWSSGARSRGVHLLSRRHGRHAPEMAAVCRALARSVHALDAALAANTGDRHAHPHRTGARFRVG